MQEGASQIPAEPEQPASGPATSSQEVEAELERILASPIFCRAPRHSRFLEFVVRKTLAGSANCVKESLIGMEVFGRPADYDPGAEPAVRVEAGRLRVRLAEYYKDFGKHDPIHIYLPKGSYVPAFSRNGTEPQLEEAMPHLNSSGGVVAVPPLATGSVESLPPGLSQTGAPQRGLPVSRTIRFTLKIVAVIVAIGVGAFVFIRMLTADNRPQSGRLEGSTFIVSNAEGQELWRKSFADGFWSDYYAQGLTTRMWFGDLEGNGHSDVLLVYNPAASARPHSTTLICYSDRGKEKWRWNPGRTLPELGGDPAIYRIDSFGVLTGARGKPSRIVVSSSHFLWYPQQIALLNSNGQPVSEYWHSGHLYNLTLADLDGDGREEIIATGISNGYRQATLVILDPDRLLGASAEAVPDLQIHGMGAAKERLRLLFPRSDLNKATLIYNEADQANILQDRIRVSVFECQQVPRCAILYDFDRGFHLVSVAADDQFRGAHDEYFRANRPVHRFSAKEELELRQVRCLVGCKTEFVLKSDSFTTK